MSDLAPEIGDVVVAMPRPLLITVDETHDGVWRGVDSDGESRVIGRGVPFVVITPASECKDQEIAELRAENLRLTAERDVALESLEALKGAAVSRPLRSDPDAVIEAALAGEGGLRRDDLIYFDPVCTTRVPIPEGAVGFLVMPGLDCVRFEFAPGEGGVSE